jgi:hypothetical protein
MSSIHKGNKYYFCVLIWKIITIYSKPSLVVVKPCSWRVAYGPKKIKSKQNKKKPQVIETNGWHVAYGP